MKVKFVAILVVLSVCLSMVGMLIAPAFSSPVLAYGTWWHVYAGDSIQTAIDNAASGDTIIVHPGTYHECISVDSSKTHLTIRSSNGAALTTIDGGGVKDVVYIEGDYTTIQGFNVTNSGPGNWGIFVVSSSGTIHVTIARNIITHNDAGGVEVSAGEDLYATVYNNAITGNNDYGIDTYAYDNMYLTVTNNNITGNNNCGIYAYCDKDGDMHMTATGNTITGNNAEGIYAYSDYGNVYLTITNNNITGNTADGIYPYSDDGSVYLTVTNSNITGNASDGIDAYAYYNLYVTITNNTIIGNASDGIYIYSDYGEEEGVVRGNTIADNGDDGIYMYSYDNCLGIDVIGNKIKNNSYGIYIESGENVIILTISGNFIADNTSDAIFIEGYDTTTAGEADIVVTIVGNTIRNNGGYGIYIWPRLDGVYVANNQIVNNDGGIYFDILYDSNVVLAHSGTHVWYSGCGADTDKALTRTFDFRRVSSATLTFWTWYATEPDYDYGYVEINDGSGWDELDSFNGDSDGWVEESYDISSYTGKMVQIRFRYETDSSVGYRGWYLDDIAISQIGFRDDVEGGQRWTKQIRFYEEYASDWGPWATGPDGWSIVQLYDNAVRRNDITGNDIGLDYSSPGPALDARNNWWGAYSGPYNSFTNPRGKGDSVSSNVIYCPWLRYYRYPY